MSLKIFKELRKEFFMQKQSHSIPKLATVNGIAVQINRTVVHGDHKSQKANSAICQRGVFEAKFLRAHGHMVARTTETHLS